MELLELKDSTDVATGNRYITAVISVDDNLQTLTIDDKHPNFNLVTSAIIDNFSSGCLTPGELAKIFSDSVDLSTIAEKKLESITKVEGLDGRLTVSDGHVLIDYEPIDEALENHILRMLREDGSPRDATNWRSFVKFVENLYANQSAFVRNQLFGWISYENVSGTGLTLTPDGCLIGYKGCAGTVDAPLSVYSGPAIVDGIAMNGQIPNVPGTTIEMPRSKVQDDPNVGCASGLHVGTYDYAKNWSRGVLLTVKVNPRDIVSVPTECDAQKIRVCRYQVIEAVEGPVNSLSWGDDDWDRDYCEECGDDCSCYSDEYDCPCDDCSCEFDEYESSCDSCSEDSSDAEDSLNLSQVIGKTIIFDYTSSSGQTSYERELLVEEVSPTLVTGATQEGYRSFRIDHIHPSSIRVVVTEEDDSDETIDKVYSAFESLVKKAIPAAENAKDTIIDKAEELYGIGKSKVQSALSKVNDVLVENFYKTAAEEGVTIGFDYTDKYGNTTVNRVLKVEEYDSENGLIKGFTIEGPRSFSTDAMMGVYIVKSEEESPFEVLSKAKKGDSVTLSLDDEVKIEGSIIELVANKFVLVDVNGEAVIVPIDRIRKID